ncbi:RDD family protein [Streptomyces sp. NBC_00986]|uniref:RDD family protein n=1 Tax=Streptomyces sp. NBC_00986 TaxID=2903702 RepID=UPI00386DA972|nr:RDD family protein [Streptomyces sp. NBC_00986]
MSAPTPAPGDDRPREGYYPDPSIPGYVRYWNGAAWVPGTSRPAPSDGLPPGAPGASVEETGPHFFDEDPVSPAAAQHGSRPEPAAAWGADRAHQSGFGGDQDRRVSWGSPDPRSGADPRTGTDPRVPADTPAHVPATDGSAPASPEEPPNPGTFVFRRPTPGTDIPSPSAPAPDEGTTTFRRPTPRTAQQGGGLGAQGGGAGAGGAFGSQGPAGSGSGGGAFGGQGSAGSGAGGGYDSQGPAGSGSGAGGFGPQGSARSGSAVGGNSGGSGVQGPVGTGSAGGGFGANNPAGTTPSTDPSGLGFGAGKAAAARAAQAQGGTGTGVPASAAPAPSSAASTALSGPQQGAPGVPQQSGPAQPQGAGVGTPMAAGPGGGQPSWAQQVHRLAGDEDGPVAPWKPPVEDVFQAAARRQSAARPAGLGRRLVARLIDTVVLGAVTAVAAVPLGTKAVDHLNEKIDAAKLSGRTETVWLLDGTTSAYLGIVLAVLLLFGVLYEALPTAKWGRTLGKKLCGIEVRGIESHEPPGFGGALRRWLVYSVPGLLGIGIVGVAWCLFDRPWHQCWHDKAAHTFVAA